MSTKPWMVVSKNKHANGFIQIAYFFSRTTESSPKVLSMNTVQHTFLSVQFSTVQKIEINFFLWLKSHFFHNIFFSSYSSKFTPFFLSQTIFHAKKTEWCFIQIKICLLREFHEWNRWAFREIAAGWTVRIPICIWTDGIDAINKFADTFPYPLQQNRRLFGVFVPESVSVADFRVFVHSDETVRLSVELVSVVCVFRHAM